MAEKYAPWFTRYATPLIAICIVAAGIAGGVMLVQNLAPRYYEVVDFSPGDYASRVPVSSAIYMNFSYPISLSALENGVVLSPSLEGSWVVDDYSATFVPKSNMSFFTVYTVTLPLGMDSGNGRRLKEAVSWSFTTVLENESDPCGAC